MLKAKTKGEKLAIIKTIQCSYCPSLLFCTHCTEYINYLNVLGDEAELDDALQVLSETQQIVILLDLKYDKETLDSFVEDLKLFDSWLDLVRYTFPK